MRVTKNRATGETPRKQNRKKEIDNAAEELTSSQCARLSELLSVGGEAKVTRKTEAQAACRYFIS